MLMVVCVSVVPALCAWYPQMRVWLLKRILRVDDEPLRSVRPPAVHVKRRRAPEEARERLIRPAIDAVEPDEVVVAIVDPDSAQKAVAVVPKRSDVEDEAARFTQELPPDVLERVTAALEQTPVGRHHRHEAVRQIRSPGTPRQA